MMIKRLVRVFSDVVTMISLVLFLAFAGAWIASLYRNDTVFFSVRSETTYLISQSHGELLFSNSNNHGDSNSATPGPSSHFNHSVLPKNYDVNSDIWLFVLGDRQSTGAGNYGFGYFKQTDAMPAEQPGWGIVWPHWSMLLLTCFLPLSWLRRWRKQRILSKLGKCPHCGYDMHVTPDRCQECGKSYSLPIPN